MSGSRDPLSRLKHGAKAVAFGSPLYNFMLGGRTPTALSVVPPDPWPGVGERGSALIDGICHFAGQTFTCTAAGAVPWLPPGANPGWIEAMHSFEALRDLRAVSGDEARRRARLLVSSWIDQFGTWHETAWAPALLGARIANWIGQHDFYCLSADDDFRVRVFDSLARQCRHLARVAPGELQGSALILALKGMAYGGLCLPHHGRLLTEALRLLERELQSQILPDGGHVERCPSVHLHVLRHLIDLRGAMRVARLEVLEPLQYAIDRMTPALRFFRHADGGLALFNGASEDDALLVDTVLAQADARGRPLKSAPHTGFERLLAGRTLIVMDTGAPPPAGLDSRAHAGTLSFELSVGKERLIVNCGAHPSHTGDWRTALGATAAHSTLTLAETNSTEIKAEGGLGRRPGTVTCERLEHDGSVLIEASHDGWGKSFGLVHKRRLYMAETGEDVRGEDRLEPPAGISTGTGGKPFAIRFHLHPQVQATVLDEAAGVLLRLPSGIGWRFRAAGAVIDLSESIYLGSGDEPRRTRQITLTGETAPGTTIVKWALRREKKAG